MMVTITLSGMAIVFFAFALNNLPVIQKAIMTLIGILMPFIYGGAIAYLLSPLTNRVENALNRVMQDKHPKIAGTTAIFTSVFVFLVIICAMILLIVPQVITSLVNLFQAMPGYMDKTGAWINSLLASYPQAESIVQSLLTSVYEKLQTWLNSGLQSSLENMAVTLHQGINGIMSTTGDLFLGIIVAIYALGSRKLFAQNSKRVLYSLLPQKAADMVFDEVCFADKMFNGFFVGKIIDSTIIGILCFFGVLLIGVNAPVLIAVIVGVTNIIPFFGPYIGAIPCILLLLIENPMHAVYFTVFIIILQQLDGNLIGPTILGNSTGLSGFWVLFSILVFGALFGLVGMIIGVPVFAIIYDIAKRLVLFAKDKRGYDTFGEIDGRRPDIAHPGHPDF